MTLCLVLVFRPVSPSSGHSFVAGRRGSPTLSTGLGSVRHTSLLELQSKTLFSLVRRGGALQTLENGLRDSGGQSSSLGACLRRYLLSVARGLCPIFSRLPDALCLHVHV
jgi:hypothetical protein